MLQRNVWEKKLSALRKQSQHSSLEIKPGLGRCSVHSPFQKQLRSICQAERSSDLYEKSLTHRSWQTIIKDKDI